ncbi:MAG TPA: acyltransferase [Polyangiaceae bacterium]|nr:acyltransferase [Polyangiaceae bacterium]
MSEHESSRKVHGPDESAQSSIGEAGAAFSAAAGPNLQGSLALEGSTENTASNSATTRPARAAKQATLPYVDGVRALCALFVLVAHSWFQPSNGFYAERWMNRLGLSYAHLAVDAFIVVSGFVICLPIARQEDRIGSVTRFFQRRAKRILPPYYAALAFAAVFGLVVAPHPTGTVWDNSLPVTWQKLLLHATLLQNMPSELPGGSVSYQFWSIAVEFQIYLLVPFLVPLARRTSWALCAGAVFLVSLVVHHFLPTLDSIHHWYISLFAMGAAAARVCVRQPERTSRWLAPGVGWLAIVLMVILVGGHANFTRRLVWIDGLVGVGVAAVLTGLYLDPVNPKGRLERRLHAPLRRLLSSRVLAGIGVFSYSLYLVHPVLLHSIWMLVTWVGQLGGAAKMHSVPLFWLILALNPLVVGAAWLFYRAFERPFLHRAPSREHTT